jgi:hypothetical protein
MIADVETDLLVTPIKFVRWKMTKNEMTYVKIKNVAQMLFVILDNVYALQDSKATIPTMRLLAVRLFPNVSTILIVAIMKFVPCFPKLCTVNVSMPVQESIVVPMLIV